MRKLRKFLALALAIVMAMSLLAIEAAAAEIDPKQSNTIEVTTASPNDANASSTTSYPFLIGDNASFTRVIYKTGGVNCKVKIEVLKFVPSQYQMDIMMYGKDGLLFKEDDCLGNSSERIFTCGADVTSVWIRIIPRNTLFPATAHDFAVLVTYPITE